LSQCLPDLRFGHDVISFTTKPPRRNVALRRGSTLGNPCQWPGSRRCLASQD
jgi:hypothetical protein